MLPIRDDIPSRTFPVVTIAIIVLNVLAFLHEVRVGDELNDFMLTWSLIPIRYTNHSIAAHFNFIEQLIQRQSQAISASATSSLSVSV